MCKKKTSIAYYSSVVKAEREFLEQMPEEDRLQKVNQNYAFSLQG